MRVTRIMLAAWALAAASVQLVQRRPGVLDAIHATQDACARAARGKKAAERRRRDVRRLFSKQNPNICQHGAWAVPSSDRFRGGMCCC